MNQENKIFGKRQGNGRILIKWMAENTELCYSVGLFGLRKGGPDGLLFYL